jgi:AcrR family transcriptional regulator
MSTITDGPRQAGWFARVPGVDREAETVRRILAGALTLAGHNGVGEVSMGGIAAAAGVSRTTVYRYFSGRDAVLDCMGEQVRHRWEQSLREALLVEPEPERRVRVVMRSLYAIHELVPETKVILERDPAFVIAYVQRHFVEYVQAISWALTPVLDEVTAVYAGLVVGADIAEILLRIVMGDDLVLGEPTVDLAQRVTAFWALVGGRVASRPEAGPRPLRGLHSG